MSMNFEIGLSNSFRPFLRKYVCIENAKIPERHNIKENIRPDKEDLATNTNP